MERRGGRGGENRKGPSDQAKRTFFSSSRSRLSARFCSRICALAAAARSAGLNVAVLSPSSCELASAPFRFAINVFSSRFLGCIIR